MPVDRAEESYLIDAHVASTTGSVLPALFSARFSPGDGSDFEDLLLVDDFDRSLVVDDALDALMIDDVSDAASDFDREAVGGIL